MLSPFLASLWAFEANYDIPKGQVMYSTRQLHLPLTGTAPISIKSKDLVFVDIQTGVISLIERSGIIVYRETWKN